MRWLRTGRFRLGFLQAIALSVLGSTAHGVDLQGSAAIKGLGNYSCQAFSEARRTEDSDYFRFGGWIEGYLTALNVKEDYTFDLAPWQTTDFLVAAVAQYCDSEPQRRFYDAVVALAAGLRPQRLTSFSEIFRLDGGSELIVTYRAVVRQLQQRLAELGHYTGRVGSEYGEDTEQAISRFQQARGLPVSGRPDQKTLTALFYPVAPTEPGKD